MKRCWRGRVELPVSRSRRGNGAGRLARRRGMRSRSHQESTLRQRGLNSIEQRLQAREIDCVVAALYVDAVEHRLAKQGVVLGRERGFAIFRVLPAAEDAGLAALLGVGLIGPGLQSVWHQALLAVTAI